jgi:hypothetical protein
VSKRKSDEIEKHYLVFERPHVYKCSCGVVMYWFPDGTQKLAEMPKTEVSYLPCGHAACAKTRDFDCIICVRTKNV